MIKQSFKSVLLFALALAALAAQAQDSNYSVFKGEPFFLLSDAAYGSADTPQVRLEVPGREMGRAAMEAYAGVDIVVYRVPQPLEFLKKQRNLHRVEVSGKYQGEGLANTLSYLWDRFWKQSRLAWRDLFSTKARQAVTSSQPALATDGKAMARPTEFRHNPQYKPLDGFEMVERFRYPIWQARPVQPPKDVKLAGSSSEFIKVSPGNVMIPIGKRKPGLYLVEAMVGEHRATTLVFVSDTVAVTKVSSTQMLVWSSRRDNGAAVGGVNVIWTDGTGVLKSGKTEANGVALLERDSPEHTYVMGEDAGGGVFVSENYYYDSEIYNTKIYAVTDRPLYRPGDEVNVKFMGREFKSARLSQAAAAGALQMTVLDPNGTPLLTQKLQLSGDSGADARFRLPPQAGAGGYELRFIYQDTQYAAAFRVAEYVKPHFEITVSPAKAEFKTGEEVEGKIQLTYPDGKPVANAKLSLSLRSQQNTMVEGELRYNGLFPVQLKTQELETNGKGQADFTLPAAKDPSRYILSVLASDGAAYRVKTTRELMIERSASVYRLKGERQFSNPGEKVRFAVAPEGRASARPTRWEMVQLEKQVKTQGVFDPLARVWDVTFAESGSYQLTLRDERNNILGGTSHWVSGAGVKATPGSIEIVLNRERYKAGDTAEVLMTFADPVDQALLTLERDKVESAGLLTDGAGWIKPVRVAPNQWRATIPVREDYGPNITFSVAYVKQGEFVFQNAGLQIVQPQIALQFRTDKEVYQPGETVTLDVSSTLAGQPVPALVALGVVDEMIYVLQPEIAPDINDFFYHPRRNNVRTTASLSFISYDLAAGRNGGAPARHNYNERGVKVLERPRRDEVDTAYWNGNLKTDAKGTLRVTFRMPDALTRWRITGRAMDGQGVVGQRSAWLRSDKQFYSKWTAPNWMRAGDAPIASLAIFNQTQAETALEVTLTSGAAARTEKLAARPGVNYVQFPLAAASNMRLEVKAGGKVVDALDTRVSSQLTAWSSPRALNLPLAGAATPLALPADARNVRVSFASSAGAHFARIADDLIDFPYGCVEQTSSRLIPLSLGVQSIGPGADAVRERLLGTLQSQRLRLVSMAGPQAVFGWWGNATEGSAMMTAYAYYADWYAARALNLAIPPEHWQNLLTVYQKLGEKEPPLQRAIILWMAQEMGLPVKTLASGLADSLAKPPAPAKRGAQPVSHSAVLSGASDENSQAMTLALLALLASQNGVEIAPGLQARIELAWTALREQPQPVSQALLMLGAKLPASEADSVLSRVRADMATFDRALTLVWVHKALGGAPGAAPPALALDGGWRNTASSLGQPLWRWPDGAALPAVLQVAQAIPAKTVAVVQYDSYAPEVHALPVQVERTIFRMKQKKDGFDLQELKAGETLRTDELYLDEIVLRPAAGSNHRYGLLEVALPPGASVEAGTWGIKVPGKENFEPLERARHEERRDGYVVPVDPLTKEVRVRHLLRFAQKGSYKLPPSRFYRMYQPDQKAFEGANKQLRLMKVE